MHVFRATISASTDKPYYRQLGIGYSVAVHRLTTITEVSEIAKWPRKNRNPKQRYNNILIYLHHF